MATTYLDINSPVAGSTVGETFTVSGTDGVLPGTPNATKITRTKVTVTFGPGGQVVTATPNSTEPPIGGWTCSGSVSPNATSGQPIVISASGGVTYEVPIGGGEFNPVSENPSGTLTVTFISPPPSLTVSISQEVTATTLPFQLSFTGTATSPSLVGHIASVTCQLGSADPVSAHNDSGDWSKWSATIALPNVDNSLTITATDTHNNHTSAVYEVTVALPFQGTFAPITYLQKLLDFAKAQIIVTAVMQPTSGPTPLLFAQQFFQPYDKLTASDQATAPVHQARIAIEVLRQAMKAATPPVVVPSATDQQYRLLAYQALLRQIGTSYDELRLARVAAPATRAALAARIGIAIGGARPDNLDQITLSSNAITDAALEGLFGYRSMSPADPLAAPSNQPPSLLLSQSAALRSVWQSEDVQTRDEGAAGALPIIDPDVISAANFTTQTTKAFTLWKERKNWVTTTLAQITQAGRPPAPPAGTPPPSQLSIFDQIVAKYVGNINIAVLAASDANGGDISATLATFYLDLDAFRFLALCRQLLTAGTLLDSEWDDVFAILLETQKRLSHWRSQEAGMVLAPDQFQPNADAPPPDIPPWRGSLDTYSDWQRTLEGRIAQSRALQSNLAAAVDSAESQILPGLRDALLQLVGQAQKPPEALSATAERLSRQLEIDFLTNAGPATTRVDQAVDTLQNILFSVRTGRMTTSGSHWTLNDPAEFDKEWVWMSSFASWLAAIKVFAYPQNLLSPSLYVSDPPFLLPTNSFIGDKGLISSLRQAAKVTPDSARQMAATYLNQLRLEVPAAATKLAWLTLTDQMSDSDLVQRQNVVAGLFGPDTNPSDVAQYVREAFWLVPIAIATRLQNDREYLAALDWFRTVYAYNLPGGNPKIYYGLKLEEALTSAYAPRPGWLTTGLNPHIIVQATPGVSGLAGRINAYTSYTVLSIVQCLLAYADFEFSMGSSESVSEARTLYETAVDLLQNPPDVPTTPDPNDPFPTNPIWPPLLLHAQSNLTKIRNGMNIAGMLMAPASSATVFLPSQYSYSVLVNRAKTLVGIAEQVESSYLSALEQGDAAKYSVLQANNDIQVAAASLTLAQLKVTGAADSVTAAQLQQSKANVEYNTYNQWLNDGLNTYEQAGLAAMGAAVAANALSAFGIAEVLAPGASVASAASAAGQLADTKASYERRAQGWQLQKNLADKDVQIAGQQVVIAQNQQDIAGQEQQISTIQLSHANEVLDFLSNKFTNNELFDWMSGVLGQVYAHFLQQATATAQLAEAQLAFERQTPPSGYIRSDYWQNTSDSSDGTNRQGLTGAEQLLEDIDQLDEYAFQSDVRTLHLTQTMSVAQIGALELQQLRETGLLVFATPMSLFDQDFPGHYLRLIQSVQVSLIALVPPVRGVRGTLSASGLSRVVVPTDYQFQSVTLGRSPEAFSFTSPTNANGLFDVETDISGLLLPFQGMGVDTVWQLELPKAANPFDYRTISDVQLTIKYTALNSYDYREQVLRGLDNTFSGDQTFSIRDDFPDAWYELNNPATVANPANQMKVTLTADSGDFQPNITKLAVQQISLFCLRQDGVTQELNVLSLAHTPPGGKTVTSTATVQTTGGIVGTRRPAGTPWLDMIGQDPSGDWTLQFENTAPVQALFVNGSIQDIALVLTVNGVTPAWP